MWMKSASYRGRGSFARPVCDLASPNGSANPTLGLGRVVFRAAKKGGTGHTDDRHNYTLISPTSPDLRFRRVLAALGNARPAAAVPTINDISTKTTRACCMSP